MSDVAYFDPLTTGEQQQEEHPGSLFKRILDTYFSPLALFRRFGARPPWVDVLLIAAVLTGLMTLLLPRDLLIAQIEEGMRQRAQPGTPAPDAESMVVFGRVIGMVSWMFIVPLMALITAGVCTLVFGMLMGGEGTFRRHLAVVSHASLIFPLSVAITMFFVIQNGDPTTQLSLALLFPDLEADSFAFRVLNAHTVFNVWWMALVGVGASAVNRRISPVTGVGVVFVINFVIVAGLSALFS